MVFRSSKTEAKEWKPCRKTEFHGKKDENAVNRVRFISKLLCRSPKEKHAIRSYALIINCSYNYSCVYYLFIYLKCCTILTGPVAARAECTGCENEISHF